MLFNSRFPQAPTLIFNGMIAPLTRYQISGAICNQGERNLGRAVEYCALLPALIPDWRRKWGYDLALSFVQLARYGLQYAQPARALGAQRRQAQATTLSLPQTDLAKAIDNETEIYPKNRQDTARRFGLGAAKLV